MNKAADNLLGYKYHVGSHGFIQLKDVMGDDERVVDAARISYGMHENDRNESKDRSLLRYLMRHRHTSPFEQCEMTFIIQSPMDVWRQWIRHRTANVNEYSTRYTEAMDMMATTPATQWRRQDQKNKQGSELDMIDEEVGKNLCNRENQVHSLARSVYKERLAAGVAREQARKDLPLSTYTAAYWKIDAHNLLHFLGLRMDPHAQLEIRQFATAIFEQFFQPAFPWIAEAFTDYVLEAVTFSRMELLVLRDMLTNFDVTALPDLEEYGLKGREASEFMDKIERLRG